jgi:hypothetical protein
MSHGLLGRDSCCNQVCCPLVHFGRGNDSTRRDRAGRWLWRLVRRLVRWRFRRHSLVVRDEAISARRSIICSTRRCRVSGVRACSSRSMIIRHVKGEARSSSAAAFGRNCNARARSSGRDCLCDSVAGSSETSIVSPASTLAGRSTPICNTRRRFPPPAGESVLRVISPA